MNNVDILYGVKWMPELLFEEALGPEEYKKFHEFNSILAEYAIECDKKERKQELLILLAITFSIIFLFAGLGFILLDKLILGMLLMATCVSAILGIMWYLHYDQ